jgi:hypothetical protein
MDSPLQKEKRESKPVDRYSPPTKKSVSRICSKWNSHEKRMAEIFNAENKPGGNDKKPDLGFKLGTKRIFAECKLNYKAQIANYGLIVDDRGIIIGVHLTKHTEEYAKEFIINNLLPLIEGKNIDEVMNKTFKVEGNLARRYKEKTAKYSTPGKSPRKTVYIVGEEVFSLTPESKYYYNSKYTNFRVSRKGIRPDGTVRYILRATAEKPDNKGLHWSELRWLL